MVGAGFVSGDTAETTTKTGQPITGRDMIALLATIGIDLGLLALAILNPPPAESRRPARALMSPAGSESFRRRSCIC